MSNYVGRADVTLDEKGRTTLNYYMRTFFEDGGELGVAPYPHCLLFYTKEAWKRQVTDFVSNISLADPDAMRAAVFIANAAPVGTPDDQGRITLPALPRETAGTGKRLVIIALGERALLFDADEFNLLRNDALAPEEIRVILRVLDGVVAEWTLFPCPNRGRSIPRQGARGQGNAG